VIIEHEGDVESNVITRAQRLREEVEVIDTEEQNEVEGIVIVISRCIKHYSKAKRTRAPVYSRALRRIKGVSIGGGQEKLRSDF